MPVRFAYSPRLATASVRLRATHFAVVRIPRSKAYGEEDPQYVDQAVLLCANHASSTPAEAIGEMSDDELRTLWRLVMLSPRFELALRQRGHPFSLEPVLQRLGLSLGWTHEPLE